MIIVLSSLYLITFKRKELLKFSAKVAEKEVVYYPLRGAILDRNGEKVCSTEWIFYIQVPEKEKDKIYRLQDGLNLQINVNEQKIIGVIPKNKLTQAVKLCRRYRLSLRKRIVRKVVPLPENVRSRLGTVLQYQGISGIEAEYNDVLQGKPGRYRFNQGSRPVNAVDLKSFRIISPVQQGRNIRLKQVLAELQCGILPEVGEVE